MDYEEAVKMVSALPNGADILSGISSSYMDKIHKSNSEAKSVRDRYKSLTEALKGLELDPDKDLGEQLSKNTKPASEFEALNKKLDKYAKEVETWKQTAAAAEEMTLLTKAREAFSSPLRETFGNSADIVLDLLSTKKILAVRDGVPGAEIDGDFIPLQMEKGLSALDKIKALYPQLVITKQTSGGKDVRSNAQPGNNNSKTVARAQFEQMSGTERMSFFKDGGTLVDN